MAKRSLEELQKQYASSAPANGKGGPGGPGRPMGPGRGGPMRGRMGGKPKDTKKTLLRMFGYLGKFKLRLLAVLFCMLGSTLTALVASFMLSPVINRIAGVELEQAVLLVKDERRLRGTYVVAR